MLGRACDDGRSGQDGQGKGVKIQELHDSGCVASELWAVWWMVSQRGKLCRVVMIEPLREIENGGTGSSFIDEMERQCRLWFQILSPCPHLYLECSMRTCRYPEAQFVW